MSKLILEVVTPEGVVFSDSVDFVSAETTIGQIGILPDHIPLFTSLKMGILSYKKGDIVDFITAMEGFLDINNNKVTVLSDIAERAENIDGLRAQKAKHEASKELMQKLAKESFEMAKKDEVRAEVRLKALEMLEKSGIYKRKQL